MQMYQWSLSLMSNVYSRNIIMVTSFDILPAWARKDMLEKLQERVLATVYCNKSLEDMLKRSGQWCIRLNLIRLLAIEMFKCMNGLNPLYINDMFSGKDSRYNLRDNSRLMQPKFNTKRYGYKSFKYLGSKVWNCLPPCVKNVNDLNLFKKNIYNWCLTGHAKNLLEQLEV